MSTGWRCTTCDSGLALCSALGLWHCLRLRTQLNRPHDSSIWLTLVAQQLVCLPPARHSAGADYFVAYRFAVGDDRSVKGHRLSSARWSAATPTWGASRELSVAEEPVTSHDEMALADQAGRGGQRRPDDMGRGRHARAEQVSSAHPKVGAEGVRTGSTRRRLASKEG